MSSRRVPHWSPCQPPKIVVPPEHVEFHSWAFPFAESSGQRLLPFIEWVYGPAGQAWWLWFERVLPWAHREVIRPFASASHWALMRLLREGGNMALDLAQSNPAIAFMLANRLEVRDQLSSTRVLLRKGASQRTIQSRLGWEPSRSARRILRKIPPQSVSLARLSSLKRALADPRHRKALSHAPRLNASALRIATNPRLLASSTPALIEQVGCLRSEDMHPGSARRLLDCVALHRALRPDANVPLPPIRSLEQLTAVHRRLEEDAARQQELSWLPFPKPPIKGTRQIRPLTTMRALIGESRRQKNCVANRAIDVVTRRVYFYSVHTPCGRATLAIFRSEGSWIVEDIREKSNRPVPGRTAALVDQWIQSPLGSQSEFDW